MLKQPDKHELTKQNMRKLLALLMCGTLVVPIMASNCYHCEGHLHNPAFCGHPASRKARGAVSVLGARGCGSGT